jgi:hypothetical protein
VNAGDILKYGHATVCKTIDGLPLAEWEVNGVCGVWSVKDIIGHLAAFETLLVEVLSSFVEESAAPYLVQLSELGAARFNDVQAAARKSQSVSDVLAEYNDQQARVMALVARIPLETLQEPGTLPWYGLEYALDDYIVYQYYGHKREHSAQIAVFRDQKKV